MYLKSQVAKYAVGILCFLIASISITAQESNPITGHALYKRTKIRDKQQGRYRPIDKVEERLKYDQEQSCDPVTGKVPKNMRAKEVAFSKSIEEGSSMPITKRASRGFSYWKSRGPYNVGGRTRALAIDITNENVLLAGGVSSGVWRSENGGASWRKTTSKRQQPNVTTIAQDPRPGKQHIWYYGTGELRGNSASSRDEVDFIGTGIYKSINGGRSWENIEITNDQDLTMKGAFDIVNRIQVQPTTGHVFIATGNGIYRSTDEGETFTKVFNSSFKKFHELMIVPSGRIYITLGERGVRLKDQVFYTSLDGEEWDNITPNLLDNYKFPPARTVMAYNPQNENEIYFFGVNIVFDLLFFKYTRNENTTVNDSFIDLTTNLPTRIGGVVGNLNTQIGGYNMLVKVHPTNSNIVIIGGTNLYRSMDGFTTPTGIESWIGGYSHKNDTSLYPDHHVDQHNLAFFPSNPNKVLSANDGGIFVTEDITASIKKDEPVDWESLNNGYLTTQPYTVSFDPEGTGDDIIAGLQDNGTWTTATRDSKAIWKNLLGADGSFNAIADGGRTKYVSYQEGALFRLNFDDNGVQQSETRVQPIAQKKDDGFSFINPFILDPNDDNIMYMPLNKVIYRNDNLDEIPVDTKDPTDVNWVRMEETDLSLQPDDITIQKITSMGVSKYPVAHRLYYGTNLGGIYRIDAANAPLGQKSVNISAGKGLPQRSYVSDINVDPTNSDRVIVSFSNYNIPSLFLTEDGGETWVNISGNLEENEDGTGNGPSVKGTAFHGSSHTIHGKNVQRVYVATSTGLYYTRSLRGKNTHWRHERIKIGNKLTVEVKTRKDGLIVVASHGSGIYSAKLPVFTEFPENKLQLVKKLEDIIVPKEDAPATQDIYIGDVFQSSGSHPVEIATALKDPHQQIIKTEIIGDTLRLSYNNDRFPLAHTVQVGLIATAGEEQKSTSFAVHFEESLRLFLDRDIADITVPVIGAPAHQDIYIRDVFRVEGINEEIIFSENIEDPHKQLISNTINRDTLSFVYNPNRFPLAHTVAIKIIATLGAESVETTFNVHFEEIPLLYKQDEEVTTPVGIPSVDAFLVDEDVFTLSEAIDDIVVASGEQWTINRVKAIGVQSITSGIENVFLQIYENTNGQPGKILYEIPITLLSDPAESDIDLALSEPLTLTEGTYWISVIASNGEARNQEIWHWQLINQGNPTGFGARFQDFEGYFNLGITDGWVSTGTFLGDEQRTGDLAFELYGTLQSTNTNPVVRKDDVSLVATNTNLVWPNPSADQFHIDLTTTCGMQQQRPVLLLEIYSMTGDLIVSDTQINTQNTYVWDATGVAPGIYFVNIHCDDEKKMIKLMKL